MKVTIHSGNPDTVMPKPESFNDEYRCPKCGNHGTIHIQTMQWLYVNAKTHEFSLYEEDDPKPWHESDEAYCPECEHQAPVMRFIKANQQTPMLRCPECGQSERINVRCYAWLPVDARDGLIDHDEIRDLRGEEITYEDEEPCGCPVCGWQGFVYEADYWAATETMANMNNPAL